MNLSPFLLFRYLNKMHDDLDVKGDEEKELEQKYVLPLLLNM